MLMPIRPLPLAPSPVPLQAETGVTAALGFHASGLHCGVRRNRSDLALIVSDRPASAAAVFTTNLVKAAPVLVSQAHLLASGGMARGIVINAGNANACTGEHGMQAARAMAAETARLLGVPDCEVLVSSTGVIGEKLPVERILAALPRAAGSLSSSGGLDAANAILTTDTCTKQAVRTVITAQGCSYTMGGVAKGSGMIHPNMATTLGFVTTDAAIAPAMLQASLRRATERSFNRITVDGDTSTNDMVGILANGASGAVIDDAELPAFEAALTDLLTDLARQVARDGEGATRLVTIDVTGAKCEEDAVQVAKTIATSPLVKTAIYGRDANWGRIIAAAGRSGVHVVAERMSITANGLSLLQPGLNASFSEEEALKRLSQDEVTLTIDLGLGDCSATVWTCDLTPGYVTINAAYRS